MTKVFIESAWAKIITAIVASIGTAAIMLAVQWPSNAVETLEAKHDKDIGVVIQRVESLSDSYHAQNVSIAEIKMDVKFIREMLEKGRNQ